MARAKEIPNRLTKEQLELFDAKVKEWQIKLGLTGWRIERSKKTTKNMAQVEIYWADRLATYRVGDFGSQEITPHSIEATVVHELKHILLYPLVWQNEIGLTGESLQAEEHNVINTIEKLLIPGITLPISTMKETA